MESYVRTRKWSITMSRVRRWCDYLPLMYPMYKPHFKCAMMHAWSSFEVYAMPLLHSTRSATIQSGSHLRSKRPQVTRCSGCSWVLAGMWTTREGRRGFGSRAKHECSRGDRGISNTPFRVRGVCKHALRLYTCTPVGCISIVQDWSCTSVLGVDGMQVQIICV